MKTLVLGGYGNFGARICRSLAGDPRIALVVAGRDGARARVLASELGAAAAVVDAASRQLAAWLAGEGVQLVIHTAGPFQAQDYGVARACAEAACDYIDLADGRRFVCDFAAALDAPFRAAGRLAVTGASTVPALSSAVVDALRDGLASVDSIAFCIAPAQAAPRGVATLAGVLSYCGAPIQVWRDGRWQPVLGWATPEPVRFARMRPRRGAVCDIPDLELFPVRYAGTREVVFRAALEVGVTQWSFAALAQLRRLGLLRSPARLAPLLHRTGRLFDLLGSPVGGMQVRVQGRDAQGAPLAREWHLTAPDHHGPEIPCMAAILLARRLAAGDRPAPGARPCMGLVPLDAFAPEFRRWGMQVDGLEVPA